MPQKFQHKRSSTAGVVPTTGQVANGEIAIKLADKTIYTNNGSAIIVIGQGPQGSNTHIQFNDSGYANGSVAFTFNKATNTMFVSNTISVSNNLLINNNDVRSIVGPSHFLLMGA